MTRCQVKLFVTKLFIFALCSSGLCLSRIQTSYAQPEEELRLVSPIGAVARSTLLPGWGQFYAHSRVQGTLSFIGTGGLFVGALITHQTFQDVYNNDYVPVATIDHDSPEARFQYNRANQLFKLRQFFVFAAVGVWAYSIIDSYVGANLYNARTKANQLIDEAKPIEKLGVQLEVTPAQLRLGIVKFF